MNGIARQLNDVVSSDEFPMLLVNALHALANDLGVSSFSAEQEANIHKEIVEDKGWLHGIPSRVLWSNGCPDATIEALVK